jgi:cellobiose-specific phosphotransferase system component IIB
VKVAFQASTYSLVIGYNMLVVFAGRNTSLMVSKFSSTGRARQLSTVESFFFAVAVSDATVTAHFQTN